MEDKFYRRGEEPDVEVLVDDAWYPGELRAWVVRDGAWWAHVDWSAGPGQNRHVTVPADRVRPDTVDRSHGRRG